MPDTISTSPPIKLRWVVGILAGLLIFVFTATYSSRMARDAGNTSDYDRQRAKERLEILAKQQASDRQILTTADWVDQAKGTVRIPIDEAMPQTVEALKAKPVQMGAAIPGAAPAAPTTIPATAGAPNAVPSTNSVPAKLAAPEAPNK